MRHLLSLVAPGCLLLELAGIASAQESQTSLESGKARYVKDDFDRAISHCKDAMRFDPKCALAYNSLALVASPTLTPNAYEPNNQFQVSATKFN